LKKTIGVLLLALCAGLAFAADTNVTGRWTGTFTTFGPDGGSRDGSALLELKQTGTEVTGTAGPNEQERHPISKGTIEGDKIRLEVADGPMTMKFDLTLTGERIAGDVTATNGEQTRRAKLDVKRAK
jgi:hypothetical protein